MVESNLYCYKAVVAKIVDGDTIRVNIDLGFGHWMMNQIFNLKGVNAPELKGDCKALGQEAKEALSNLVLGKNIILQTQKSKKRGRWLGVIYLDTINVNEWLIANNYGEYCD
jgi:micrococcal nuclease